MQPVKQIEIIYQIYTGDQTMFEAHNLIVFYVLFAFHVWRIDYRR